MDTARWQRQSINYFAVPKPLWKGVKHLFPKSWRGHRRGRPPLPDRLVLNAIGYVLWTGCQWKALSHEQFGVSSRTAHVRFQLWQQTGIFAEIMAAMVRFYAKRRKIAGNGKRLMARTVLPPWVERRLAAIPPHPGAPGQARQQDPPLGGPMRGALGTLHLGG